MKRAVDASMVQLSGTSAEDLEKKKPVPYDIIMDVH